MHPADVMINVYAMRCNAANVCMQIVASVGRTHQPKLHNGAHRTIDVVRTVAASAVLIPADMTVLPLISGKTLHMEERSGRSLGGRIHDCTNIFSECNAPYVITTIYAVTVFLLAEAHG